MDTCDTTAALIRTEWTFEERDAGLYRIRVRGQVVGDHPCRVHFAAEVYSTDVRRGRVLTRREIVPEEWTVADGKRYEDDLYLMVHSILTHIP